MLVRRSIKLSSTSTWQKERQLNFRLKDLMMRPSVRMMMNEV
ncbi:hypothetical protein ERO13_D01G096550v2 [Gossypium hirsutum]|nr:hypothetical protein ERO13_D01G096550v2 [Gossypium hirsutum]